MIRTLIIFICFALTICSVSPVVAVEREYRIFIVNSYHPEYFWSARQGQGIKDAMAGLKVVSREYFMDSKRHPEEEWLAQQKEICLSEIAAFKPDLIFTGDDNATRTIAPHFLGQSLPVVFYGVNAEPESYGLVASGQRQAPGANVTGIIERQYFIQAARKLKTLCYVNNKPISKLYFLSDDRFSSGKTLNFLQQIENDFEMEMVFLPLVGDFATYKRNIEELNHSGNAVFIYSLETLKDETGRQIDYREALSWTRERLQVPSIAVHRQYIEEGLMFGLLMSGYNQAFHAGLKAKQILLGAPSAEIPIDSPAQGLVGINKATFLRLGFKVPLNLLFGAEIFE